MIIKFYTSKEELTKFLASNQQNLVVSSIQNDAFNTEIQIDTTEFILKPDASTYFVLERKRQVL